MEAITGADYIKLPYGPAPRLMKEVRQQMESNDDIVVVKRRPYLHEQHRVIPQRHAEVSLFTAGEIALVEDVIDMGRDATGTEFSNLSHEFLGWKLAENMELIPYETVFLGTAGEATCGDMSRARELAEQHGW